MTQGDTCIILGGGHNGLVAAFYLARAGLNVTVLERDEQPGGGAITEEIFPGFRTGTCAYLCHLLQRRVIDDMQLRRHGFHVYPLDPAALFLFPDGQSVRLWHDPQRTDEEMARVSPSDRGAYPKWVEFWEAAAGILRRYFLSEPPSFEQVARDLAGTPESEVWDTLLNTPSRAIAEAHFNDQRIAAAAMGSSDYGAISDPGSALTQAYFKVGLLTAHEDFGIVRGGMGGVSQAMAAAAAEAGAEIRTGNGVSEIIVDNGSVAGVRLDSGEEIDSRLVLSNADPKSTLLCLVNEGHLHPSFVERVSALSTRSASLKLHAALDRLPDFSSRLAPDHDETQAAMVRIMPSLDQIEASWRDAMNGRPTRYPLVQLQIPSLFDPTLAPPGKHVTSAWVTYEPFSPRDGSWGEIKMEVGNAVLDEMERYVPGIRSCISHWDVFTPQDISESRGMTHGNIRHLDMTPGQLFANRNLPGCSAYRTPISGLYICGAGTHPGGEVTGAPGHNAAQAVLRDLG